MGGNDDYVKPPKLGQEIGTYKVTVAHNTVFDHVL